MKSCIDNIRRGDKVGINFRVIDGTTFFSKDIDTNYKLFRVEQVFQNSICLGSDVKYYFNFGTTPSYWDYSCPYFIELHSYNYNYIIKIIKKNEILY